MLTMLTSSDAKRMYNNSHGVDKNVLRCSGAAANLFQLYHRQTSFPLRKAEDEVVFRVFGLQAAVGLPREVPSQMGVCRQCERAA
jgi:hypothetical protein